MTRSATGRSLAKFTPPGVQVRLYPHNSAGLPSVYNAEIERAAEDEIVVFMHDDVFIVDYFWNLRLAEALEGYDAVGVIGNRRLEADQLSWAFVRRAGGIQPDETSNFRGLIAHGSDFVPQSVQHFSQTPCAVAVFDGVFMAGRAARLRESGLRFDERFRFHFYDIDFCREAARRGLKLGTASVSLIHESGGNFASPEWLTAYSSYLAKWNA